jgi:hypothetical protein
MNISLTVSILVPNSKRTPFLLKRVELAQQLMNLFIIWLTKKEKFVSSIVRPYYTCSSTFLLDVLEKK